MSLETAIHTLVDQLTWTRERLVVSCRYESGRIDVRELRRGSHASARQKLGSWRRRGLVEEVQEQDIDLLVRSVELSSLVREIGMAALNSLTRFSV